MRHIVQHRYCCTMPEMQWQLGSTRNTYQQIPTDLYAWGKDAIESKLPDDVWTRTVHMDAGLWQHTIVAVSIFTILAFITVPALFGVAGVPTWTGMCVPLAAYGLYLFQRLCSWFFFWFQVLWEDCQNRTAYFSCSSCCKDFLSHLSHFDLCTCCLVAIMVLWTVCQLCHFDGNREVMVSTLAVIWCAGIGLLVYYKKKCYLLLCVIAAYLLSCKLLLIYGGFASTSVLLATVFFSSIMGNAALLLLVFLLISSLAEIEFRSNIQLIVSHFATRIMNALVSVSLIDETSETKWFLLPLKCAPLILELSLITWNLNVEESAIPEYQLPLKKETLYVTSVSSLWGFYRSVVDANNTANIIIDMSIATLVLLVLTLWFNPTYKRNNREYLRSNGFIFNVIFVALPCVLAIWLLEFVISVIMNPLSCTDSFLAYKKDELHKWNLTQYISDSVQTNTAFNASYMFGFHNSYHRKGPFGAMVREYGRDYINIEDQLEIGARDIELDVHYMPTTDRFMVYHVETIDSHSSCKCLQSCLDRIKKWARAHPNHSPILIRIEPRGMKTGSLWCKTQRNKYDISKKLIKLVNATLEDSDKQGSAKNKIFSPTELMNGTTGNVHKVLQTVGWPSFDHLRGRFIVMWNHFGGEDDNGSCRGIYNDILSKDKEMQLFFDRLPSLKNLNDDKYRLAAFSECSFGELQKHNIIGIHTRLASRDKPPLVAFANIVFGHNFASSHSFSESVCDECNKS